MHDNLKARLASGIGYTVPTFPKHVEQYIDRANELYRAVGYGDAPWQVMPLLVLMAELEKRLGEKTVLPYVADNAETPEEPTVHKVHWKTRQAEERKAAMAGA